MRIKRVVVDVEDDVVVESAKEAWKNTVEVNPALKLESIDIKITEEKNGRG
jgi:hypothetical protein